MSFLAPEARGPAAGSGTPAPEGSPGMGLRWRWQQAQLFERATPRGRPQWVGSVATPEPWREPAPELTNSPRHCGGDEGERRLRAPRREVEGLDILFLFHLGRGTLTMDDWLGVASSSVRAAKTLKSRIGVGHVKADLENAPHPPTWRAKCRWVFVSQEHRYHAKDSKVSNAGGCTREI
jgi:hypothetical protein